jgi:hypothetical protein
VCRHHPPQKLCGLGANDSGFIQCLNAYSHKSNYL